MKKIIITAAALLLGAATLFAGDRGFYITGGYAMGLDKYTDLTKSKSKEISNGFYAGIGYNIKELFGEDGSIDAGIQYAGFWGKQLETVLGIPYKGQQKDSYIQIPVRARYTWENENVNFFLYAGPKFMFGLKSQFIGELVTVNWYAKQLENAYKRFNLMLGLGGGIEIGGHFRIDLGYDWGVINRYKGDLKDSGCKLYESMLTAGVAVCF